LIVATGVAFMSVLGALPARANLPVAAAVGPTANVKITEVPLPGYGTYPNGITIGADGNVWFAETGKGRIGRMTIGGHQITEFVVPGPKAAPLFQVTLGPDRAVWFTEEFGARVGRITTNGRITQFKVPWHPGQDPYHGLGPGPTDITTGPDGNLWFTEQFAGIIVRLTPGGTFTEFALPTASAFPTMITTGPDGNLWFIESRFGGGPDVGNRIGRITPEGVITEFPIPTPDAYAADITAGPDGNVWFTENLGNKVARITPAGVITEFPLRPNRGPEGITTGPDGNLWFTEDASKIGRITPAGRLLPEVPTPTPDSGPAFITAGPDNRMYFTESAAWKIGITSKVVPS